MNKLAKTSLPEFQERFCFFHDALIKRMSFSYDKKEFRIVIETQDYEASVQPCWCHMTLVISGCFSMKTIQGNAAWDVLSTGVHIIFENEHVGLEFGDFVDTPESMVELETSPFHVAGKSLSWSLTDEEK